MFTVGEMVKSASLGIAEQDLAGTAFVPVSVLRSLGIWDAEVHEAAWDPEGGYSDYGLLQVWFDKVPTPTAYGPRDRVRVIVLPKEE